MVCSTDRLFGCWEAGSIKARSVSAGIHARAEQVTRFILARKTDALTFECGTAAQQTIFDALQCHMRRSMTMDRRYLPTPTDFPTVADKEFQEVITENNNQPQKCLGQAAPAQVYPHPPEPHRHYSVELQV